MFERVLERLLLKFLAPYVEGLPSNAVRFAVRSGILELRDLRVKPEALSLLGVLGYSVKSGYIGSASLHVSWKSLFTGRLYIAVEHLYLEAHEEAIPPEDMRVFKSKTVDLRMEQLKDMLEHYSALEGGDLIEDGFLMRINRKILNNLNVKISDVGVWLVTTSCPQAVGVELPGLTVTSADAEFREIVAGKDAALSGKDTSMRKILRVEGLALRLSAADSSDIAGALHVLSPMNACIRLTHAPLQKLLRLHVELGCSECGFEQNRIVLRYSQWVHFFMVLAEAAKQAAALQAMLVAPEVQRALLLDVEGSAKEYGLLYERGLALGPEPHANLDAASAARMQLLEDALPVRPLAQQRWLAHCSLERSPSKGTHGLSPQGWVDNFSCLFVTCAANGFADEEDDAELYKADLRDRLLAEINDVSKVEEVERPARVCLDFVFRELNMFLIDDRWLRDENRELLSLVLPTALMTVEINQVVDSKGEEFPEWGIYCDFGAWQARHAGKDVLSHLEVTTQPSRVSAHSERQASSIMPDDFLLKDEDRPQAAKLVVESKLDSDSSILKVCFDSTPFEILLLPGMIGRIIEFFSASADVAEMAVQAAAGDDENVAAEVLLQGLEMYQKVQDQIPDRLFLDLSIAAPILRAPVEGRGNLMLCLGHLRLSMAEPCSYDSLDLNIQLSETVLSAVSMHGEHFNMIQPVPAQVQVLTREQSVDVNVFVESLALFLAPEALEMLLCLPDTVNAILDECELPAADEELSPSQATPRPSRPSRPSRSSRPSKQDMLRSLSDKSLFRGNARLLEGLQEGLDDALRTGNNVSSAPKLPLVNRDEEQLIVTTTVCCDVITLTLADMLMSMLRLQLALPAPGLIIRTQKLPEELAVCLGTSRLELEALSHHSGAWEPVIETFSFGLDVKQPSGDDLYSTAVRVDVLGQSALLLNLTPTILLKINKTVELVTDAIAVVTAGPGETAVAHAMGEAKYRVFNLCACPFEIQFFTPSGAVQRTKVHPTGSNWQSLDDFILPCFATGLTVCAPGGKHSRLLHLELDRAAVIPGCQATAELFAPAEGAAYRALLLAPPLRLFNLTDTPLHLQFHQGSDASTMPVVLEPEMVCSAELLGIERCFDHKCRGSLWVKCVSERYKDCGPGVLPPNAVLAVPEAAVTQAHDGSLRCWLSVGTSDAQQSLPVEVGAGGSAGTVMKCKSADSSADVYVEWEETHASTTFGQTSRNKTTLVKLQPPVTILNAVPLGTLQVRYAQQPEKQNMAGVMSAPKWSEATVDKFSCLRLHDVSSAAPGDLLISARLDEAAAWSAPVRMKWHQLRSSDAKLTLDVQQSKRGAAVGLTVEPVHGYSLRISCPFWFVDCSGIEAPLSLQVNHRRKQLPSENGLVLLPSMCDQEPVDLQLRRQAQVVATLDGQYMPPHWSVMTWDAGTQPLVFCVQAERIDPRDVFGAECTAMVLRPRLVLTNTSEDDIELLVAGRQLELPAGQSREHHWHVGPGADVTPSLQLAFRPCGTQPQRQWSSTVTCEEESAGSTPFLLRPAKASDGPAVEVWSVEIAPKHGALAVSFKKGSNFVAKHNAPAKRHRSFSVIGNPSQRATEQVHTMRVRPCQVVTSNFTQFKRGTTAAVVSSELPVVPGELVPFGWDDPFGGSRLRAVDVVVNGKVVHISDVRHTAVFPVPDSYLVVRVARQGVQTLLVLEHEAKSSAGITTADNALFLNIHVDQVGISCIEEAPELQELLYVHLEPVEFAYWDTDSDAFQLDLKIDSAQVDCQLPGRKEEGEMAAKRVSRRGKALRSSDVWKPAVVLRNLNYKNSPFLNLSLQRSAIASGDIVIPKVDLALDKVEIHIDDDWLEGLIRWSNKLQTNGLDQVISYCTVVAMAGRSITADYQPPPLPSVVQVEDLRISDVKFLIWCRLRLGSLSFLPQYVLTAVRAVSMSNFFTLNGASVSLKRRHFPAHRGSLEDFLAALGAEYGRSVVANIFSLLHSSSLLNLPRAPLKIGQGAVNEMAKGVRHMTEAHVSPKASAENGEQPQGACLVCCAKRAPTLKKVFSRLGTGLDDKGPLCRRRLPRLLLPAVGELRPWCPLEAALLGQLGRVLCREVHEVVRLRDATDSCCWAIWLLLCAEKLLVICLDAAGNGGDAAYRQSVASSTCGDESNAVSFFERTYADSLYAMHELQERSSNRASQVRVDVGDLDRRVRGLSICSIRNVLRPEGKEPELQIEDAFGKTHKLVLPLNQVSSSVREAIADGLCNAVAECEGDANWTALRATLYGERRRIKVEPPPDLKKKLSENESLVYL